MSSCGSARIDISITLTVTGLKVLNRAVGGGCPPLERRYFIVGVFAVVWMLLSVKKFNKVGSTKSAVRRDRAAEYYISTTVRAISSVVRKTRVLLRLREGLTLSLDSRGLQHYQKRCILSAMCGRCRYKLPS